MNTITIELIHPNATPPETVYPMALAYDLFAAESLLLEKGARAFVPTGVRVTVPHSTYASVTGRASMSQIKVDVYNSVFSCNYSGEVDVLLENNGNHDLPIMVGDKIALLVVLPMDPPVLKVKNLYFYLPVIVAEVSFLQHHFKFAFVKISFSLYYF